MNVGDTITRDDGARFRIVGVADGAWVAAPLDAHGPPVTLTGHDLAGSFNAAHSDPLDDPDADARGWSVLSDANARAADALALHDGGSALAPAAPSPEDVFAAVADDGSQES